MDEHVVTDPHNRILVTLKSNSNITHNSMDESPKHHGKRKKSGMKHYRVCIISFTGNPRKGKWSLNTRDEVGD